VSNYVPDAFNHNQRGTEVSTYTDLYGGLSLACQPVEIRPRWPPSAARMMLPGATDLMAGGDRLAQGCRLSQLLRLAALEGE
jgi:hypothetical protein